MIKKIRQKFVAATMLLLCVTVGILFIVDSLYTKYWDTQYALNILERYAGNGIISNFEFEGMDMSSPYGNPIFSISLDKDFNILDVNSSSAVNAKIPSDNEIKKIIRKSDERHKWKSYLYIINKQADGGYLLVITDTSQDISEIYRKIGNVFLILIGFLALLLVSFVLSKFVTEPAKKALDREKQFVSDASHELKTPLAAISINAQALQPLLGDNRHLQNIISETSRMDGLIQKLLKLSYTEEISGRLEKLSFSLSQCCEETALSMESIIYEQDIKFEYNIEENITYIGNEDDIRQVVTILLDNAVKHTPAAGIISFRLTKHGAKSEITVENSGHGIAPDDLPHIFERFYRADKSRITESNSYGLGLAIAKAILDSHEATISVSSIPGRNTRFTINL